MIKWRLEELARERGYSDLRTFLINHGFTEGLAGKISRGEIGRYSDEYLWAFMEGFKTDLNGLAGIFGLNEEELKKRPWLKPMLHEKMQVNIVDAVKVMDSRKLKILAEVVAKLMEED